MVIPIVVGRLGTVSKGLEKRLEELEIRGRIETASVVYSYAYIHAEYILTQ